MDEGSIGSYKCKNNFSTFEKCIEFINAQEYAPNPGSIPQNIQQIENFQKMNNSMMEGAPESNCEGGEAIGIESESCIKEELFKKYRFRNKGLKKRVYRVID